MSTNTTAVGFELSVSARDDGTIEAVYISLSNDSVARTEEISEDILLADYNKAGDLVGLELLAPVKISELAQQVKGSQRASFRKFVKKATPADFVLA